MLAKLKASIEHDASAGIMAVREMDAGTLEVIDGNHRLDAIRELGWTHVQVENFGKLSDAEAVVLAERRNHQWFETDDAVLSKLMKETVLPELSLDELEQFMPRSRASLEALVKLTDFNWDGAGPGNGEKQAMFAVTFSETIAALWPRWIEIARRSIGDEPSRLDAFELLLKIGVANLEKEEAAHEVDG
jgi:hypothetical protein